MAYGLKASSCHPLNQLFESVSGLFAKKNIKKDITSSYKIICVCIFWFYW